MFRITPELYVKPALANKRACKSLNQWADEVLAEKIVRLAPASADTETKRNPSICLHTRKLMGSVTLSRPTPVEGN